MPIPPITTYRSTVLCPARRTLLMTAAALPAAIGVPGVARAQAKLSAREFFRYPQISSVSLAPGGKTLAGVGVVNGRRNLVIVDLATRKTLIITNYRDLDVVGPRWISDNRLIFSLRDFSRGLGDQDAGGLFAIDRDGANYRALAERFPGDIAGERALPVGTEFVSRIRENGAFVDDIFVMVWSDQGTGRASSALRRVNTRTGQSSLAVIGGPSRVVRWIVDRGNVARAALVREDRGTRVLWRELESSPWRPIAEYGAEDANIVVPLAFDADGALYVSARQGRDLAAIYRHDAKAGALEAQPLLALKDFDLEGGLRFTAEGRLLGVTYTGERDATHWLDNGIKQMQEQIDRALPNRVNELHPSGTSGPGSDGGGPTLIYSYSDQDPGRYYLFDAGKKQLEQVAVTRPWLEPAKMAQTDFVRYAARDGLSIPAMLTLPPGSARKNLPLVVMHYGGPWVRAIDWDFDPAVQFLASRGYAVLMPAPRASTGFGFKHFRAGFKQWGLAMQDDITDGVKWLIAQGTVDPKRVCIAGASYGGYAAMQALATEPELFRCGINWIGVTDPEFMHSVTWTDFAASEAARFSLNTLLGDPQKDAAQFAATSPLRNAARIKQPVLMAYGGLDRRVPIVNGERMRSALAPHNPNVEWIVYSDEGHGWLKEENNIDFWTRVEAFLTKHMG
jgi:dipeptidyl aminopeptidase/acylaminoacyl peptidase